MGDVNVRGGEVFAPAEVPVGQTFEVQFYLNNTESVAFGGEECSIQASPSVTIAGHLSRPRISVTRGGSVVTETGSYYGLNPPEYERDDGYICCPITGPGAPDPLVTFRIQVEQTGTYSITAISDPLSNPQDTSTISIEVVEADEFEGPSGGEDGVISPREGDVRPDKGSNFLTFAKNNPLAAGIGSVAAIVAVREGVNTLFGGGE